MMLNPVIIGVSSGSKILMKINFHLSIQSQNKWKGNVVWVLNNIFLSKYFPKMLM